MQRELRSGLKTLFAIHMIVGYVLGLGYMLIPEQLGAWLNWEMSDPVWRVFGAAVFALGFSSMMALRTHDWQEVKILVELETLWLVLGALITFIFLLNGALPVFGWVIFTMMTLLAIGFGYYLFTAPRALDDRMRPSGGMEPLPHQ